MQQPRPAFKGASGGSGPAMMEGDWNCASCGDHQFARNMACRKCGAPKSDGSTEASPAPMIPFAGKGKFKKAVPDAFGMGSKASSASVEQGDWFCASCNDHQFARNIACRKCGASRPDDAEDASGAFSLQGSGGAAKLFQQVAAQPAFPSFGGGGGGGAQQAMQGDWNCPACGDHQFARNQQCRKCGTPKDGFGAAAAGGGKGGIAAALAAMLAAASGGGGFGGSGKGKKGQMVEGDWLCPSCGDHQFARNLACRKCGAPKDDGAVLQHATNANVLPGDWICPGCGDHQFQKNMQCRKCGMDKPASAAERSGPYMK